VPSTPFGNDDVVIVNGVVTVSVKACVAVCGVEALSLTLTTIPKVPVDDGVPDITPVVDSAKPEGSDPEIIDHEYGDTPPAAKSESA
jgi:hypothetical protein